MVFGKVVINGVVTGETKAFEIDAFMLLSLTALILSNKERFCVFKPLDQDLYFNLALSPWEAILGADIEVPTLESPVVLSVPALTRNAQKLRLKGRGLGDLKGSRGDLYAVVHIESPTHASAQEIELYEQLSKISKFNPRDSIA